MLVGADLGACAFLFVQLQRLAPRVISRTSTEIRISFEFRLMLVGADRGASAFLAKIDEIIHNKGKEFLSSLGEGLC